MDRDSRVGPLSPLTNPDRRAFRDDRADRRNGMERPGSPLRRTWRGAAGRFCSECPAPGWARPRGCLPATARPVPPISYSSFVILAARPMILHGDSRAAGPQYVKPERLLCQLVPPYRNFFATLALAHSSDNSGRISCPHPKPSLSTYPIFAATPVL